MSHELMVGVKRCTKLDSSDYDAELVVKRYLRSVIGEISKVKDLDSLQMYGVDEFFVPSDIRIDLSGSLVLGSGTICRCVRIYASLDQMNSFMYFASSINLMFSFLKCKMFSVGDFELLFVVVGKDAAYDGLFEILSLIEAVIIDIVTVLEFSAYPINVPSDWFTVLSKIDL
jgi:hypothetical protein